MKRMTEVQKGRMAKRLVYYCISVLSVVTVWALVLKSVGVATGTGVDLSDVLTFVGAVFGGELLMLLVKRIFAKPKKQEGFDESFEETDQP